MNKFIFLFSRISVMVLFFMVLKFFQIEPGPLVEKEKTSHNFDLEARTTFKKDTPILTSSRQVKLPEKERNIRISHWSKFIIKST